MRNVNYSALIATKRARANRQGGVSMIEVLVSMFVMAVGILGVVSLQSVSIQDGVRSQYNARSQMIVNDLVDRMYANRPAAANGNYAVATLSTAPTGVTSCEENVCTSDQLVSFDIWEVVNRMSSANSKFKIPSGALTIRFNAPLSEYRISLTWDATGDDEYTASDCAAAADISNPGCSYSVVRF